MTEQRRPEKFCKLKNITVTVLEENLGEELGSKNIMKWNIKECLNKDDDCNNLDCKYVCKGIGDCGKKDPFN